MAGPSLTHSPVGEAMGYMFSGDRTTVAAGAHTEYQDDPIGWVVDMLGVPEETLRWSLNDGYDTHRWDGTKDPLSTVLESLAAWDDVGVESGTGTGKTFLGACVVLWFLACWEDSIVVTLAPKLTQLTVHIWKEIGRLWPRFHRHFPQATFLASGVIRMKPAVEDREVWTARAFGCGVGADEVSATKAQGFHAEHMLILMEETPGMHPAIMVALENTSMGGHNLRLAFGNPDFEEDELHQFCLDPDVTHVRVSALDHPNVVMDDHTIVPGAVSTAAVERRERKYAHTPSLIGSRIRGISPAQAVGVALNYIQSDHLIEVDDDVVGKQDWPLYGALDFGAWRFAFVLGAADRDKRMHLLEEYYSEKETLSVRADYIHNMLTGYGASDRVPIWGDSANPQDIMELNDAFKRMGSGYRCRRVRKTSVEGKHYRAACVERLNDLLGRKALLFRRGIGDELKWHKGRSVASEGREMTGSRLLWEIRNWRYPVAKGGKAQQQDPDDDTADGSDGIAALRYLIMSWWLGADDEPDDEPKDPNIDTGLEEKLERIAKRKRTAHRHPF